MLIEKGEIYIHTKYEEVPTCICESDWEHDGDSTDGFADGRYICTKDVRSNLILRPIDESGKFIDGDTVYAFQAEKCRCLYKEPERRIQ